MGDQRAKVCKSEVLTELNTKLSQLPFDERKDLAAIIGNFKGLFTDVPNQTTITYDVVEIGHATPIIPHPYRVNRGKPKT